MKGHLSRVFAGILVLFALPACGFDGSSSETIEQEHCRFFNESVQLYETDVKKGDNVKYKGRLPTKSGTGGFYTFSGWDKSLENIQADTDFNAQFSFEAKTYTVTYLDYNRAVIKSEEVGFGLYSTPPSNVPDVVKEAEVLSFAYWDKDPTTKKIISDTTFTACYSSTDRKFPVHFVVDGVESYLTEVVYNNYASYGGPLPAKASSDEHYQYSFMGWDQDIKTTKITKETTFTAVFEYSPKYYRVAFYSDESTLFYSDSLPYGSKISDGIKTLGTPTKTSTASTDFTFSGWDRDLSSIVTGPVDIYAQYTETTRKYQVRFLIKGLDGSLEELQVSHVAYGEHPTYSGATPTLTDSSGQYFYTFTGWDVGELSAYSISDDTNIYAQFSKELASYTVTFLDSDGTTALETQTVAWGATPVYSKSDPTKDPSESSTFVFAGWSPSISRVAGNQTYTATYTETLKTFTVTYKNYDGSSLGSATVNWGEDSSFATVPTKASTSSLYSYKFTGWSPSDKNVKSNLTCVAQFAFVVADDHETNLTASVSQTIGCDGSWGDLSKIKLDRPQWLKFASPDSDKVALSSSYSITITLKIVSAGGTISSGQRLAFYDFYECGLNRVYHGTDYYFGFVEFAVTDASTYQTVVATLSGLTTIPQSGFIIYPLVSQTTMSDPSESLVHLAWTCEEVSAHYSYVADPAKDPGLA